MALNQQYRIRAAHGLLRRRCAAALACALMLMAQPVQAAEDAEDTDSAILNELAASRSEAHARLLAGVWIPRLGGQTHLDGIGGAGNEIDLDIELDLDDIEPTANFELLLAKDVAAIHLSGFSFSTSQSGTFTPRPFGSPPQRFGELTLGSGDRYRASVDMDSVAMELQMNWLGHPGQGADRGSNDQAWLSIVPTLAGRWTRVQQSIESGGVTEQADEAWFGVLAGAAVDVQWEPGEGLPVHAVRFQAAGSIGPALGGDGGFMWHVRAGVNVDITPRLSAMFGYRLLELDVDNDAYTFEAGLQGLFFAGSYRF